MRIRKLKLKKLINTRDLGGMPCEGGVIARGKLFRSGKLYRLPEKTVRFFTARGVNTVIDMRIDTEVGEYPDTLWEGARYIRLPLICTATPAITHDKRMRDTMESEGARIKRDFGSADAYMLKMYEEILFSESSVGNLRTFFRLLIDSPCPVIWHCSGGKDRAGIAAMLAEGLLGVPEEIIIKDYTASARFQRHKRIWQKIGLFLVPGHVALKRILYAMMRAPASYIRHAMDEIKLRYGSVENYCAQALGLTAEDISAFRLKYTQKTV